MYLRIPVISDDGNVWIYNQNATCTESWIVFLRLTNFAQIPVFFLMNVLYVSYMCLEQSWKAQILNSVLIIPWICQCPSDLEKSLKCETAFLMFAKETGQLP